MPKKALELAIEILGGQARLARTIATPENPCSQQNVYDWLKAGRCRPNAAIPLEKATSGQVSRQQLRPDLYPEK
jgi:DNA-binding transcriptional regulator YdaS (Cro superfamily)